MRKVLMTDDLFEALGASRVDWGEPDGDGFYTPTVYRDTGPRPDSGIDVERLARELNKRVKSYRSWDYSYDVVRERDQIEARQIVRALSTPRTETSETADTIRIGSKTYLAGSDDD